MKNLVVTLLLSMVLTAGVAIQASAQPVSPTTLTMQDNKIEASFVLAQDYDLALSMELDNAVGLHPNNIDITAELVLPTDPRIVDRLPDAAVSGVAGFPVLVTIEPKADRGFAFEGVAQVEFYTRALHFDPAVPWRLFTSHQGEAFEDITTLTTTGSYRARGSTGRLSDFVILLDERDDAVITAEKVSLLQDTLYTHQQDLPAALGSQLSTLVGSLQSAVLVGNTETALALTDQLISLIEGTSGNLMPDVWRAGNGIYNVKGELLSRLHTLRYSLRTQG